MALRDFFSNVAETEKTPGFKTKTFAIPQARLYSRVDEILPEKAGFRLVHKSPNYGECMFKHKSGEITLTLMSHNYKECAIAMHVMTKRRFGFPKKFGQKAFKTIKKEISQL